MQHERNERIRLLFSEALEQAPAERAAWLERACAGDDELRREVESLLAALETHGDDLEQVLDRLPRLPDVAATPAATETDDLVGRHVLHYEVLERLGTGGMGVVYRARDTRLQRAVALKFLPTSLPLDPTVRQRFLQEARAASALDHPNICTVHDIGESEQGHLFIAMAYVEGETLRDKLARRPLPLDEAIEIAVQVAAGLARAHELGIVHRDVKPANVMVTGRGQVKIVDFGLAKVPEVSLTRTGVTLGTMAYMSPEQVRGEALDHRADIWALGVLLYEMVTGRRPFSGERSEAIAHAILHANPEPMTALRSGMPLALEGIVAKAMEKDPAARYQHVDEVPVDLRALPTRPTSIPSGVPEPARRERTAAPRWKPVLLGVLLGLAAAAAAFGLWHAGSNTAFREAATPVRFSVTLPLEYELTSWHQPFALSPDGTRLVYSAHDGADTRLYLRALNRIEATAITGTENGEEPFFSPDGRWIGFFADGMMKKVPVAGGIPQDICPAPQSSRGASWNDDDTILFTTGVSSGLMQVTAAGGTPEVLTTPNTEAGEIGHVWPQRLPGGQGVLFTIWSGSGWRTGILPTDGGPWRTILEGVAAAHYLPTGHLLYAQMSRALAEPGLLAVPFDAARLEVTGTPAPVLDYPGLGGPNFAVSRTGTLVYVAGGSRAWAALEETSLVWVDAGGTATPLLDQPGLYEAPRLSPDGTRVSVGAFSRSGTYDVWIYELERGTSLRLTTRGTINNFAVWTPDGTRVAFNSARFPPGLYWKRADGAGEAEQLVARKRYPQLPGSWSPDGRTLAFSESNDETGSDIWMVTPGASPSPFLVTGANETSPRFSPDGRYLAYASDASGRNEVYVRPYLGPGTVLQVSSEGGHEPVWAQDGQTLLYRQGGAMMATEVTFSPLPSTGGTRRLFEGSFEPASFDQPNYDVARDGRFLMLRQTPAATPTQLHVVLNWFEELRELPFD